MQPGEDSHLKVFLNGKQSALPVQGTAELGKGLEAAIKRQLGLKYQITMFNYRVTLAPDDDTVLVTFADVPEAITFGVNEQEALMQAIDALEIGLWF